ncbi:MAG: cysteine--tRNA ligase [Candidatus Planktophila sp.]|nr:cysteine--tRNA ligase [Candidatus Planktophila sp.]
MISIYDTLARKLSQIESSGSQVTVYCCGPTVYRDAHVGNLRTFLLADLIHRALIQQGAQVNFIQNITDVGHMSEDVQGEDKILQQAHLEKRDPFEIARAYEAEFHKDLQRLNILPASAYPRASETINLMQHYISKLIDGGFAYATTAGSVYFDSQSFESYGAISGNRLNSLKPGHRYEFNDEGDKRFHADWALWKAAGSRTEMIWDSPWGLGFPGWHIECTAMSLSLLGNRIDIHVGGIDLRFPHHENERAQSNSIINSEAVGMWVHGEHLLFEGRKMSKSSGNVVLLQDVIDRGLDPLALRLCLLENRYRAQMDLTWAALEAANSTLRRWRTSMGAWGSETLAKADAAVATAIKKDLDTPRAILRLRAIEKDVKIQPHDKRAIFLHADQVLGLELIRAIINKPISPGQELLLSQRATARELKNWSQSDLLRDELLAQGILISDGPTGQSWSWT